MKLVIKKELKYINKHINKDLEYPYEYYEYFFAQLKKHKILYKEWINSDGLNIVIYEQLIRLDEHKMNKFFYDVLSYFDYDLRNDYDSYDKKTFCLVVRPKQVGN